MAIPVAAASCGGAQVGSRRARGASAVAVVALVLVAARPATGGLAQEDLRDDEPAVTFDEALALGPLVPEAMAPARALEARGDAALSATGATAQPFVQVNPGFRFRPDPQRGLDLQVTVSQSWSLSGLAGARRSAERRERDALGAAHRARQLAHRLEAAHAWIARHALERRLSLVTEEVRAASALLEMVRAMRRAGESTAAEEAEARAHLAEVSLHAVDLEGVAFEAGLSLARRLGRDTGRPVATGGVPPSPELPDRTLRAALAERVGSLPAVRAARLTSLAARARGAEERVVQGGAALTFGASYQREAPNADIGFLVAGVTLPVHDLASRQEAVARGEAAEAAARADQARIDARVDLAEAWHEVEHTREVEATIRDDLLPAVDALVRRREALLRAGELTLRPVLRARERQAMARDRLATAEGVRRWAEVRAWLLYAELAR